MYDGKAYLFLKSLLEEQPSGINDCQSEFDQFARVQKVFTRFSSYIKLFNYEQAKYCNIG
jgi:hypothetical protein